MAGRILLGDYSGQWRFLVSLPTYQVTALTHGGYAFRSDNVPMGAVYVSGSVQLNTTYASLTKAIAWTSPGYVPIMFVTFHALDNYNFAQPTTVATHQFIVRADGLYLKGNFLNTQPFSRINYTVFQEPAL